MNILLFGTGDYYNRYRKWFEDKAVLALLDNSEQKQYTVIDGLKVLPPEEGIKLNYDIIIILSFYVKQMRQQLVSLGVESDRIYHFYDLHQLIVSDVARRPLLYFLNAKEIVACTQPAVPKILLLSHDLTLGGPSIALFHAAEVLKKKGYMVVFASMFDGPLKEKLIRNEIPVIVDENLQIATMQETEWVSAFSLLICNTLNFHVFLSERDTEIPVIWWLHDARFFYDGVNNDIIRKIRPDNLKIVSVGVIPAAAIKEFLPDMACGDLLYGVADTQDNTTGTDIEKGIIRFITIGFLETRKGQDILLQAIRQLPSCIRSNSEFYIVGHAETILGESLRSESVDMNEIVFTGRAGRQEIHKLLSRSDVLVCPSRQDPMPTVAAEAMMHSVPCIVSDVTGTAAYIHDGEDGFIVPSEDVQALAEKIAWCVENRDKLKGMGKRARELYENHFSMPVFEKRFVGIVEDALGNGSG